MTRPAGESLAERYLVRRVVARNDQCEVAGAEHRFTGRQVAIKSLRGSARSDPAVCDPFLTEIRLLGGMRHRSVVDVLDAGATFDDGPYLVTEMLDGRTLDGLLASRGSLFVDETVAILLSVSDALAFAKSHGIVHGRLSPASILLPSRPVGFSILPGAELPPAAKLLDFGLSPNPMSEGSGSLSAVAYAAPERLAGRSSDARCDVYSLGAILCECLTGSLPSGGGVMAPPPDVGTAPAAVAEVASRALGFADARYPDAAAFAEALRQATVVETPERAPEPVRTPPPEKRRAFPRAAYITPVRVVRVNNPHVDLRSEDVSESGMLVVGAYELEDRERVTVRFPLPKSGRVVSVAAVVRWRRSVEDRERYAVGLEFEQVPADVRAELAAYAQFFARKD
jgi:serine/threonine protein kinase